MKQQPLGPYDMFALALSLAALLLIAVSAVATEDPEIRWLIDTGDLILCALFFIDFLRNLAVAPSRWAYLRTWGWLDLLASIPAVDALRLARMGRVVRILRALRAVKAARTLFLVLSQHRRESALYGASFITLMTMATASIAILHFERPAPEANIVTAEDALWWSVTTITTVGYGDRYPVTTEGRLVAAGLLFIGVGLAGAVTGAASSWFVGAQPPAGDHQ